MPSFLLPEQMKDDYSVQLVGETVRLCCLATGRPMPVIVWYKNGLILPEATDSTDSSEGGTSLWQLKLPSVKVTDSGRYTCKVFNRIGTINFTYPVQVIGRLREIHIFKTPLVLWCYSNPLNFYVQYIGDKF